MSLKIHGCFFRLFMACINRPETVLTARSPHSDTPHTSRLKGGIRGVLEERAGSELGSWFEAETNIREETMVSEGSPIALRGLVEIRNRALLLSLGRVYLCHDPILKKIGRELHEHANLLQQEILSLKEQFPGKFAHDIDTHEIMEQILIMARRLQEPDQGLNEKCSMGILGRELEAQVKTLALAIGKLKTKVEGTHAYTPRDAFARALGGLTLLGGFIRMFTKILAFALILAMIPLAYLYFTMENEGALQQEVARNNAHIQAQMGILADLEQKKKEILSQIRQLEQVRKSRQDTVDILELNQKLLGIDGDRNRVEADIRINAKKNEDVKQKIQKLRGKSFVERILRL